MKGFYKVTPDGQIRFEAPRQLHKTHFAPDSAWLRAGVLFVVVGLCALADFGSFSALFSAFLYDSPTLRYLAIFAMLMAFDVGTVYLGINLKRIRQGYRAERFICYLLLGAFLTAAIVNMMLRIKTKDLAFPLHADSSESVIWEGAQLGFNASDNALYYAIGFGLFPVITSLVSFTIAYMMTDFVKSEYRRMTAQRNLLLQEAQYVEATLEEYRADPDVFARLREHDRQKFEAATGMVEHKKQQYRHYVRERIKEYLGTPPDNSALSKPDAPSTQSDAENPPCPAPGVREMPHRPQPLRAEEINDDVS